ncbi:MAG: aldo/keto reductase [Cellulophaga sp.]
MNNKLILGTVQLGLDYGINNTNGRPSISDSFDILNCAFDNGIRILDTAEGYGESQEVIGAFHKKFPNKIFNVISKISAATIKNNEKVSTRIKNNLKILGVERLEGYMFHNFSSLKENSLIYEQLIKAKRDGLIAKIGASLYGIDELREVTEKYDFDFVQLPFNMLDNENIRAESLREAKKRGIEIHTRSVFLQGLFFKETDEIPESLNLLVAHLKEIKSISLENEIEMQDMALSYATSRNYIDNVLIGVDSTEQLLLNLNANKQNLPLDVIKKINKIKVAEINLLNPFNW